MKKTVHKIAAILMAFVVILSTMSFTIDMHYCGDTLVETAVFKKAKDCGMEMQQTALKNCDIIKKDCCNNVQIAFDSKDEIKPSFEILTFKQQQFVASFVYSYVHLFKDFTTTKKYFQEYKPPLVYKEIYKVNELYLI
ncbi:HYC_CC_PP family protein [Tenacibaculum insulae]|uniref:HYC_CC_PP family protein n=1 Tax=Tenacibaculum insulae TaxID=2029677 RepID=UPI003AB26B6D